MGELLVDDLLGHQMGLVSSVSSHLGDGLLELLFRGGSGAMVREVVEADLASVLFQDLADYPPVVDEVPHRTRVVQEDSVLILFHTKRM